MLRRLKIKFVCINMLIVTLMLAVIFGMILHSTRKNMEYQSHQTLQSLHQMRRKGMETDIRIPYFIVHINKEGSITISSNSFSDETGEMQLLDITRTVYAEKARSGVLQEHNLRYSQQTTPFGERIVFIDISRDKMIMQDLVRICSVICLISLVVFLVISIWLAQWAVHPVDEAWKQQQQFVADASHELKTPLTVILTNSELLRSTEYEEAEQKQFVQNIHTMSLQMRGLVEGLLDLARLDNGTVQIVLSEVNFSQLIEESVLPFEPVYFEKGLELESAIDSGIKVKGSASHLRQVMDILLDNALKYALPASRISVCLQRRGNTCLLSVANPGEEITREDLKNIFKRFYRIDKARSMNLSYGLGLSIAQSIVLEHRGKIWAESADGVNTFFVQLPLLT